MTRSLVCVRSTRSVFFRDAARYHWNNQKSAMPTPVAAIIQRPSGSAIARRAQTACERPPSAAPPNPSKRHAASPTRMPCNAPFNRQPRRTARRLIVRRWDLCSGSSIPCTTCHNTKAANPSASEFGQCAFVSVRLLRRFERRDQCESTDEEVHHAFCNVTAMPHPSQPWGQGDRGASGVLACAHRPLSLDLRSLKLERIRTCPWRIPTLSVLARQVQICDYGISWFTLSVQRPKVE